MCLAAGTGTPITVSANSEAQLATTAHAASTSTPSFVIVSSRATPSPDPVYENQAFYKQWNVSADADGQIPAIEALTLDLPGEVFVMYAAASPANAA